LLDLCFSSDSCRDSTPQVADIQVGTPNFGSIHFITTKYAAINRTKANHSGIT